jgi:hypothetical protein
MLVHVRSPRELIEMVNRGFSRRFVQKMGVMIAKSGACGLDEYFLVHTCSFAQNVDKVS